MGCVIRSTAIARSRRLAASRWSASEPDSLVVHRLVQAVTRDGLDETTSRSCAEMAVWLVDAALPRPPWEHVNWPTIAVLLPHATVAAANAERLGVGLQAAATILNEIALYRQARAAWSEAEPLYRRAIAISEQTRGSEADRAIWFNNLAGLYQETGRYDEAEPLLQRAVAIAEQVYGPEHPSSPRSSTTWLDFTRTPVG